MHDIKTVMKITLYLVLCILCVCIASVAIQDGSKIVADLGDHIVNLFRRAHFRPDRSGFNEFIQLIAIAVFVGWVISTFKNKGGD